MSAAAALLCTLLVATAPESAPDEQRAAAALVDVQRGFGEVPRQQSEAALQAIARQWPATAAAGRALLWLGDVALLQGDEAAAEASYRAALAAPRDAETRALAFRGIGRTALHRRHWCAALAAFDAADADATPMLRVELAEQRRTARRELRADWIEDAAWVVLLLGACYFVWRLRRAPVRAVPAIVRVLAPVDAVLLLLAWGRDRGVWMALIIMAVGSLAVMALGFGARDVGLGLRRRLADAALITAMNAAVIFVALHRAGILDVTWETLRAGSEVG